MRRLGLVAAVLPLLSGGCVAQAAWSVATLPVKAVSKTADLLTTSPKERDEKWARQQRKSEERRAKEYREAAKRDRKHRRSDPVDADLHYGG